MRSMIKRGTHDDRDLYFLLIQEFPLRPIRSEAELSQAAEIIDRLSMRDDLDSGEEDYLDVLDAVVSQYESEHHKIEPLGDADLLRELIEARDVTQRQVAEATGIVFTTISAVLAGRRKLTRDQVGTLARYFNVAVGAFLFDDASA